MIKNNKFVYGLLALFVGFALSLNTAIAQETQQQDATKQHKTYTGKVVDASTNQPLANVTVEIPGQNKTATTDQDGKFTFEDLDVESEGMVTGDEIEIRIEHQGYEELTETVSAEDLTEDEQRTGMEEQEQRQDQQEEDVKTFKLQPQDY